ncbi:hypothetical protein C900_00525 [Fulvivirga imtechensis AK7]|uniref:Uncharacterized protein n=1 Tax=Fulvivirga imtechensis AK7 TaxID=1237149 RepID=L8JLS6_9BACT|nr:hypothetical protein C900_00525 [Fulvivirga imtechensis AK7]
MAGTWKRTVKRDEIVVEVDLFGEFNNTVSSKLERKARNLTGYFGKEVTFKVRQ